MKDQDMESLGYKQVTSYTAHTAFDFTIVKNMLIYDEKD